VVKRIILYCHLIGVVAGLAVPVAVASAQAVRPGTARVDFDRDVRPILADNCFACHGFDEKTRVAGLRLDTAEGATKVLKSGKAAIVPGTPEKSTLLERVHATNALRMPPAATKKTLTDAQKLTLRRWIEQGARYEEHWAFIPPKRPALPKVKDTKWPVNAIDRFILARLEKEGLRPSPPADRETLIRRVTLDLTGLPPTLAEVNAFVGDRAPGAYERLVDRLLASPRFGERMALPWLDLARYADTHGYHIDSHRDMWLWREWVINAYNRNLPYDRFVVEQLAGDLLPNATLEQKIATGFNRNHPINYEGGAIPEEYHAAYIMDRIDTTSTAFMALTMECGQCHDHKYDPLTQKEFYQLYAFFHNVDEQGLDGQKGNAKPFIKVPTPEQEKQLASYGGKVKVLEAALKERSAAAAPAAAEWERRMAGIPNVVSAGLAAHYGLDERFDDTAARQPAGKLTGEAAWADGKFGRALKLDGKQHVEVGPAGDFERTDRFSYGAWIYPTSREAITVLSRMDDATGMRGWDLYLSDRKVFAHLIHEWDKNLVRVNTKTQVELNKWVHVLVTYDGSSKAKGVKIYVDGKPAELDLTHDTLTGTIKSSKPLVIGRRNPAAPFHGNIDEVRIWERELSPVEVELAVGFDPVRQILAAAPDNRTAEQKDAIAKFYLAHYDGEYRSLDLELADWRKKRDDLDASIPTTMVMQDLPKPRDTHILIRGEYDKKGEKVAPGVPAIFPPLPAAPAPNRLTFAEWLVSPTHPLTARVAVNRFWQTYFGNGLVRTSENFGTQGERPSHPELLDYLAVLFASPASTGSDREIEGGSDRGKGLSLRLSVSPSLRRAREGGLGWDVKALVRLIVTSATYRQHSGASSELLARDPDNILLARGPRQRLPAEFIRDQALAVSGLLVEKIGGPSVKPYQPPGLWEEIAFGGNFTAQKYEQDHGEALYRRSIYTFWKRTCPPPSLQTFDAPEREFCIVRRSASNTPLQALVLMNDPTFVEASRHFAERIMTEVAATPKDRIRYACRLALSRQPTGAEIRVLLQVYDEQLAAFRKDEAAAKQLLSVGESKRNEKLNPAEHAAWTSVASVLFNMDEFITKS
jgi:hypothetical protein